MAGVSVCGDDGLHKESVERSARWIIHMCVYSNLSSFQASVVMKLKADDPRPT